MRRWQLFLCSWALALVARPSGAIETAFSGSVGEQARVFWRGPAYAGQSDQRLQPSLVAEVKFSLEQLPGNIDCYVNPYIRHDSIDDQRQVLDWQTSKCRIRGERWTFSLGTDVEAWGVLDFVNPTDVLNQRDLNEDLVSKRRLSQPLAALTISTEIGSFAFYGATRFTPLSFPGVRGRLLPALPILAERAEYGSRLERFQPEAALRYGNLVGPVQVDVSYFYGYQRDPSFGVSIDAGSPFLYPIYALEHQGGLELQATLGNWLLKSEGALRLDRRGEYASAALGAGLEYDLGTLFADGQTLSLLLEYDYDTRPRTLVVPFTNDLFVGARLALNDVRSTELTAWSDCAVADGRVQVVAVDGSLRLVEGLKAAVGLRFLPAHGGAFGALHRDQYLNLRLSAFF